MIKRYNEYVTEKLSDKLSGFNEEELKKQLLNGELDFNNYLNVCEKNNIQIDINEIKQWFLTGKIKTSISSIYSFYEKYNVKPFSENELIKILKNDNYQDLFKILIDSIKFKLNKIFDIEIKNYEKDDNFLQLLKYISMHNNIHAFKLVYDNFEINKYMLTRMLLFTTDENNFDMIKILIEYGADIYDTDNKILRNTVIENNFESFKFLVDNYYDINKDNKILLNIVVYISKREKYIDYLLNKGIIVDESVFHIPIDSNIRKKLKKIYDEQHDN